MGPFLVKPTLIFLLSLYVRKVLLLHRGERCVLNEHVIHEFIPVNLPARIRVNFHKELVKLLEVETFSPGLYRTLK